MNKEEIQERFIEIMDNEPHVLIELWNERAHDIFYKKLYEIKELSDSYFKNETEINPMRFICGAYCFDGDRTATLEKTKCLLNENEVLVNMDAIIEAYVELERIEDLGPLYKED